MSEQDSIPVDEITWDKLEELGLFEFEALSIKLEHGKGDIVARHPVFGILARHMANMVEDYEGENYLEVTFAADGRKHHLTIRKDEGKSPHELRTEAEAALAAAEQRVGEYEKLLRAVVVNRDAISNAKSAGEASVANTHLLMCIESIRAALNGKD